MTKTVAIDVPYVVRLARNSGYNWMASLRTIRALYASAPKRAGCGTCRQPQVSPTADMISSLGKDVRFRAELIQLKQRLNIDKLIVSVGPLRTSL